MCCYYYTKNSVSLISKQNAESFPCRNLPVSRLWCFTFPNGSDVPNGFTFPNGSDVPNGFTFPNGSDVPNSLNVPSGSDVANGFNVPTGSTLSLFYPSDM